MTIGPATRLLLPAVGVLSLTGCTWMSYIGTDTSGAEYGQTWFVGGAGPIGNVVGTVDVPTGLRAAGYQGAIEVFGWQSVVGGTLRDQMDRERNMAQARRLADRIQAYLDDYPGRRVDIIALSAGTGIATWALESLPEDCRVGTVVFLASSLSRRYDLSEALRRVDGRLYCFYSREDNILRVGIPLAGSVDRESETAAGLYGFALPEQPSRRVLDLYRERLRNRPYKARWRHLGYHGQHTDCTKPRFIAEVVAPLLEEATDSFESP
jgi:pimeloyl-ACP methyl ester carboxylesterase